MDDELVVFTNPGAFSPGKDPGQVLAGHAKGRAALQDEVLFLVGQPENSEINDYLKDRAAFLLKAEDQDLEEQLLANDSLGG